MDGKEEFKLDPDVDIEELAEQLYGKGASKSVSFLTQTKNDVAKYIDVLKTGTRKKFLPQEEIKAKKIRERVLNGL